jgi:hypothetical protein
MSRHFRLSFPQLPPDLSYGDAQRRRLARTIFAEQWAGLPSTYRLFDQRREDLGETIPEFIQAISVPEPVPETWEPPAWALARLNEIEEALAAYVAQRLETTQRGRGMSIPWLPGELLVYFLREIGESATGKPARLDHYVEALHATPPPFPHVPIDLPADERRRRLKAATTQHEQNLKTYERALRGKSRGPDEDAIERNVRWAFRLMVLDERAVDFQREYAARDRETRAEDNDSHGAVSQGLANAFMLLDVPDPRTDDLR